MSKRTAEPHAPPKHTLLVFTLTLTLFTTVAYLTLSSRPIRLYRRLTRLLFRLLGALPFPLPLTVHLSPVSELAIAVHSLSSYSFAQQKALVDPKRRALARLPRRHRDWGRRLGVEEHWDRVEECIDRNAEVLDRLAVLGMEEARRTGEVVRLRRRSGRSWAVPRQDSRVIEVCKHLVRDWSDEGRRERDVLFTPILEALQAEFCTPTEHTVVVPGCGLARLAYEIALLGFKTEANDFSQYMNLASTLIFRHSFRTGQYTVHPFIHSFSHHRSAANMLRPVTFPNVLPDPETPLRFVPGDFTELFTAKDTHDAVVTLFFIDTAHNICDYLETIYRILKPGGIWINLGPLLYYGNPALSLPLEEVLRLVTMVGFVLDTDKQRTISKAEYTADALAMYSFTYDCEFFVARKPRQIA